MSEKASYFKLGLFVVVGVIFTLAGITVLGAGALFRSTIHAETYMEESVQGLDVGAPVKHRGVQIGKVSRIAFLGEEYTLPRGQDGKMNLLASFVVVEIELETGRRGTDRTEETFKSSIQAGLHTRLASSGLVGNVFLELYFPESPAPELELTWEPRSLYIPSTHSVIAELTSTVSRIAGQLESARLDMVAKDIDRLVNAMEQKVSALDIESIQRDASSFLDEVRASNQRLRQILDAPAIDTTLQNLADTSGSLKRITGGGEGDISTFIKDLPEISTRLRASATEIESILADERVDRILTSMQSTADLAPEATAEVRRVAQRLNALIRSQESDLATIVRDLAQTAANLQRMSEDASKNPSRLLFGDPPPPTSPSDAAPARRPRPAPTRSPEDRR